MYREGNSSDVDRSMMEDLKDMAFVSETQTRSSALEKAMVQLPAQTTVVREPSMPARTSRSNSRTSQTETRERLQIFRDEPSVQTRYPSTYQGVRVDGLPNPAVSTKLVKTCKFSAHVRSKSDSSVSRKARLVQENVEDNPIFVGNANPHVAQHPVSLNQEDRHAQEPNMSFLVNTLQQISTKRQSLTQTLYQLDLEENEILSQITRLLEEDTVLPGRGSHAVQEMENLLPTQQHKTQTKSKHTIARPISAPPQSTPSRRRNRTQIMTVRIPLANRALVDEVLFKAGDRPVSSPSSLPMLESKRVGSVSVHEPILASESLHGPSQSGLHRAIRVPTKFGNAKTADVNDRAQSLSATPQKNLYVSDIDGTGGKRRPATPAQKRSYETPHTVARKK